MTALSALPDKALSIRQPWVWAILNAGKDIENRPRQLHYRGPICLHAGLHKPTATDMAEFGFVVDQLPASKRDTILGKTSGTLIGYRGGIIGTAEIVDCVDHSDSPWFFGPYGLVLRNIQPVPFIAVKGALGLFIWKKNIRQAAL